MFQSYEDFEEFISKRIAMFREQKNISARDMSLSLGLGAGYINNIENRNSMPSMQGLYYICEFLQIAPKDFFDVGTEAPELLTELITACRDFDRQSLKSLLEFIINIKTKK